MATLDLHLPVLAEEVLTNIAVRDDGQYIDATYGRGGHARLILDRMGATGKLLAIDKDPQAIQHAKEEFVNEPRFSIAKGSFANLREIAIAHDLLGKVDGLLLDLGVSSPQLDRAERGFSFLQDGPLDMRMDPSTGLSAEEWINEASQDMIATVLKEYGEERFAKRIAAAIVTARAVSPITRTLQLADIVTKANPKWEKHKHPATRSFQGIRIFINRELEDLSQCLADCLDVLKVDGRLLVISFHSLEDRIVKRFINEHVKGGDFPRGLPVTEAHYNRRLKSIAKNVRASEMEVKQNPRARSAVLRVAEKIK